jgi:hypothetical protein
MPIKTIKVETIRKEANRLLALPTLSQEEKRGIVLMLEHTLHKTDNYGGYNFTYWAMRGRDEWDRAGRPDFPEKQKYLGLEYDRYYYTADRENVGK